MDRAGVGPAFQELPVPTNGMSPLWTQGESNPIPSTAAQKKISSWELHPVTRCHRAVLYYMSYVENDGAEGRDRTDMASFSNSCMEPPLLPPHKHLLSDRQQVRCSVLL